MNHPRLHRRIGMLSSWLTAVVLLVLLHVPAAMLAQGAANAESASSLADASVLSYIHNGWESLTRSTNECVSLTDSKLLSHSRVIYLPADMTVPPQVAAMQSQCGAQVLRLPKPIKRLGEVSPESLPHPGLLYLPNPYVVPGGRFNEMYGWDSYFIIRGLLEEGKLELARGMVENFFFEIEHYGGLLNANRTYYLTRSHPPFLSSMILAVHHASVAAHIDDREWLARAYGYAQREHRLWTSPPKFDSRTGLSRYYDYGHGPIQEIGDDTEYYEGVADWLVQHPAESNGYVTTDASRVTGPALRVPRCGGRPCEKSRDVWLTDSFYKGDRAARESGYDISFRFGPFSGSTQEYAPVCLNSLLFQLENDLATIARELSKGAEASEWARRANDRKQRVNRYLWNNARGLYVDYNLVQQRQSKVLYATTFFPLWTGLASAEQAARLLAHLPELEQPGGLAMSDLVSGLQWDKPYGWAPLQLITVEGLRRYGYKADADRISRKFLSMVIENEAKDGTIREKYNVIERTTVTSVTSGYAANVVGFGWTNGTFLVLLHGLSEEEQQSLLRGKAAHAAR